MKKRSFLTFSLLTVFLLVSCAQTPVQTAPPEAEPPPPAKTQPPAAVTEAMATEASEPEPEHEFVPRGPDLEATDPATVSLASGELQLVEFFRFT